MSYRDVAHRAKNWEFRRSHAATLLLPESVAVDTRLGLNDDPGREVPPGKVIHVLHAGVEALRASQTPG